MPSIGRLHITPIILDRLCSLERCCAIKNGNHFPFPEESQMNTIQENSLNQSTRNISPTNCFREIRNHRTCSNPKPKRSSKEKINVHFTIDTMDHLWIPSPLISLHRPLPNAPVNFDSAGN